MAIIGLASVIVIAWSNFRTFELFLASGFDVFQQSGCHFAVLLDSIDRSHVDTCSNGYLWSHAASEEVALVGVAAVEAVMVGEVVAMAAGEAATVQVGVAMVLPQLHQLMAALPMAEQTGVFLSSALLSCL